MTARLCVVGAGRSGAVTAACLAELGHYVHAVDVDDAHIATLQSGRASFYEPRLDELIQRNASAGRLSFTTDYKESVPDAEFVLLAVGTPPNIDGTADLSYMSAALAELAPLLAPSAAVVTRSTVPVGTNRWVAETLRELGVRDFDVISNPEFLREGHAVDDFLEPDRIVIGALDNATALRGAKLYERLDCPILLVDLETAELIKYAANAYLAASVSFINEIANIAERLGADITQVSKALALDERIGPHAYLAPGIGFGGSCLPKDLRALVTTAERNDYDPRLLKAIIETNDLQPRHVVAAIEELCGSMAGRRIALLGISFKGGTFDARSSPAVSLIKVLMERGAEVHAYDPLADESVAQHLDARTSLHADPASAADGCDAVIVATNHPEFRELDLQRIGRSMARRVLIDGRNVVDPNAAARAGFTYLGIGRPRAGQ
jgi:UDPglucose 6-dehydrogenase